MFYKCAVTVLDRHAIKTDYGSQNEFFILVIVYGAMNTMDKMRWCAQIIRGRCIGM